MPVVENAEPHLKPGDLVKFWFFTHDAIVGRSWWDVYSPTQEKPFTAHKKDFENKVGLVLEVYPQNLKVLFEDKLILTVPALVVNKLST